jgi:hypothetical protein
MPEYMLLMRGSQAGFLNLDEAGQQEVINEHLAWSRELSSRGILISGAGFSNQTVLLTPAVSGVKQIPQPFAGTDNELSGFYLIKAESLAAAIEIAHDCPALQQGESVEVVPLGH